MKTTLQPVIQLIYPALQDFCDVYDYTVPPVEYFKELRFKLPAKIETKGINALRTGQFSSHFNLITLATLDRTGEQILKTLLHELGHAIQYYNLGSSWNTVYNHQAKLFGYTNNTFEKQARYASSLLEELPSKDIKAAKIKINEIITRFKDVASKAMAAFNLSIRRVMYTNRKENEDSFKNEKRYSRMISNKHSTRFSNYRK